MQQLPPKSTLFPYTTLFRSHLHRVPALRTEREFLLGDLRAQGHDVPIVVFVQDVPLDEGGLADGVFADQTHFDLHSTGDRKSTRLNSSHQIISYAVFCLKKK